MMPIRIAGKRVGAGEPVFAIAELGLNHGGSVDEALRLVDAAAEAGASAIKLQTLRGATLVAPDAPPPMHVPATSLAEFFAGFELDEAAHAAVFARARRHGLAVLSTPFDLEAVDLLERTGVDAYKIASGDVTHHQLIARAARTGRPLILSTGMSDLDEVAAAVVCARLAGARELALLHCVSAYPVPAGSENLAAIATLARRFDVPVGLSDHSQYDESLLVAVALGACLYERHLVTGPVSDAIDAAVSSTPGDLRDRLERAARGIAALGAGRKECLAAEQGNRTPSRRGWYAARHLDAGDVIDEQSVVALRPATDLDARAWPAIAGRVLAVPLRRGQALSLDMLAPSARPVEVRRRA